MHKTVIRCLKEKLMFAPLNGITEQFQNLLKIRTTKFSQKAYFFEKIFAFKTEIINFKFSTKKLKSNVFTTDQFKFNHLY